jgi:N-acetylglucosamine kinase-like BadF-type ATPase
MIVLGADLGGTSVRVALFEDGVELARVESVGGSMRLGLGGRIAAKLAELARPLVARSGATRPDVFVVGAAGAGRDAERDELRHALERERVAWRVIVIGDGELARAAAFNGQPGVLLTAGTGSVAVAADADGNVRQIGGLGWRMGDQGSGHWLGLRALQAIGAMHDGTGPSTHLVESVSRVTGTAGIGALVRWSTTATVAELAALGPAVVAAADHGDRVAGEVVTEAVDSLCRLAVAAGAGRLPVVLAGGLLAAGRPLHARVHDALVTRHHVEVRPGGADPCRGAPVLAGESRHR